jgi:hypothetical protein
MRTGKAQTERLDLKEVSVKMTFRYPKSRLVLSGLVIRARLLPRMGLDSLLEPLGAWRCQALKGKCLKTQCRRVAQLVRALP